MIFFNNQLMKTPGQLYLFLVSNPQPFTRYEDHHSALFIQLHELIEQAIADGQNPVALIEEYLKLPYNGGDTVEDMAAFLFYSDPVIQAMSILRDNWSSLDPTLPEDSIAYGTTTREEAVEAFSQLTLTRFLEALTTPYDE